QANKLIYHPGEEGVIHVRIKNKSTNVSCSGTLDLFVTNELVDRTAVSSSLSVTLAGGETKSLDIPFGVGRARFGHELSAILRSPTPQQDGQSPGDEPEGEVVEAIAND